MKSIQLSIKFPINNSVEPNIILIADKSLSKKVSNNGTMIDLKKLCIRLYDVRPRVYPKALSIILKLAIIEYKSTIIYNILDVIFLTSSKKKYNV